MRDTAVGLKNTTKCVGTGAMSTYDVDAIVRMGASVAGGEDALRERPLVYFCECPVSPLKITRDAAEVIMGAARHGIPNNVTPMAMSGASSRSRSPARWSSTTRRCWPASRWRSSPSAGASTIYGSSTTAMDLRLAAASVGWPVGLLERQAFAELAQRYLLPSFVWRGYRRRTTRLSGWRIAENASTAH